jgi:hypothetical protein
VCLSQEQSGSKTHRSRFLPDRPPGSAPASHSCLQVHRQAHGTESHKDGIRRHHLGSSLHRPPLYAAPSQTSIVCSTQSNERCMQPPVKRAVYAAPSHATDHHQIRRALYAAPSQSTKEPLLIRVGRACSPRPSPRMHHPIRRALYAAPSQTPGPPFAAKTLMVYIEPLTRVGRACSPLPSPR